MLCSQPLKQLLDRVGKALISDDLGCPAGISSGGRELEERQDGDGGWLVLVGDVGVVACRGEAV